MYLGVEAISMQSNGMVGVGDGNRTHNVWSHSPVLCQLSYSHRSLVIITSRVEDCGGWSAADSGEILQL